MNPSIPLQLRQPGDENGDSPGRNRPARCGYHSPNGRSLIGWGSYMEPAHPGENRFLSPYQKSFHACTTTTRGRKRSSPRSTPPRTVWKPRPTSRSLIECSCMKPAHPGEDRFPSPDQKSSIHLQLRRLGDKTVIPRVNPAPHCVQTPTPLARC